MEYSSLISGNDSEQKIQSNERYIIDNNAGANIDSQQENSSNTRDNLNSSDTLKYSLNLSSEPVAVHARSIKLIEHAGAGNVLSNEINSTNNPEQPQSVQRFRTIIDSDSDDAFTSLASNKSKSIDTDSQVNQLIHKSKCKSSRLRIDSDSDSDVEGANENKMDNNQSKKDKALVTKTKSKKFSDLIDSESEDEDDNRNENYSSSEGSSKYMSSAKILKKQSQKEKSEKKRTGTKRAAKDEAMRHIHSETQRLIREAPISLPYHRPKQRSLQEFLNRKNIAPAIPQASTAAAKLRMCTAIVSEVVKEKEKEAELFYKSSDSEEDETPIPIHSQNSQIHLSLPPTASAHIAIESTQKLHKVDIQNAQNKKQIIQQGTLELGVPRKLFLDINDPLEVESIDTPAIVQQAGDDDVKKRMKECKQGLKEVSVPRKLFDHNFEDNTGGLFERYESFTSDKISNTGNNSKNNQVNREISQYSNENSSEISTSDENNGNEDKAQSFENSQNSLQPLQNETIIDLTATQSTSTSHISISSSENRTIHETPIISNKDIQKLNSKVLNSEKTLSLSEELCTDDTTQSSEADYGVVGLPPPVFDDDVKIIEAQPTLPMPVKKNTLMNLPKLKPKLRGTPGTIIDFTQTSKSNKEAVNNLVGRFLSKHSMVNKHSESHSQVTVIQTEATVDGFKIYEDVLSYNLPAVNESADDADLNKPGAKLMRLKEELKKKMTSKRNEEWKQRAQESMLDEEEEEILEFEPEDKDETSAVDAEISDAEESEPEENDVLIDDKKRKMCVFGDEEAEVDEDENMDLSDDENEEDGDGDDDEEDDEDDEYNNDKNANDSDDEDAVEKQKKFSRIIPVDDDSNLEVTPIAINNVTVSPKFERKRTDIDMFDDDDDDEDVLPVSPKIMQESQLSPVFKTPLTPCIPPNSLESRASQFSPLTMGSPCIHLNTKLINLNSQSSDWQSQNDNGEIRNKLFDTQDHNVTDEELMELCTGKFTDVDSNTQIDKPPRLFGLIDSTPSDKPITESQIISMCSGTFSSPVLLSSTELSSNVDETSQDIRLTFDDVSQNSNDNILEKKLEKVKNNSDVQSSIQSFLDIASSSDDEIENKMNNGNKKKVLRRKKVRQLVLSDDEDEGINGEDHDEEENNMESDEDEEKFIDYDSEENEVVVVNKKDLKKVAANFVDAEAELSESEWGSEDEDENGMDKLELEDGDAEEIDEDQMRAQLGKLHARQLLDDDQRDVRMLKEILFEDGDLHTDGAGRERKFKWRNIDKLGDENLLVPTNDDNDENQLDHTELANELEWRKLRMEREKFLEEKIRSDTDILDNDIDIESGSKLLMLGMKVLRKCKTSVEIKKNRVETTKSIVPRTVSELIGIPDDKTRILHNAMKRGSFLARGDEALARLAVMIKKSDTVDLAPKHSKNFLFTHISPSVTDKDDEDHKLDEENTRDEDEKNNEKPVRKRKPAASGTPRIAKKPKIDMNRLSTGKKLF